jgi:hypothetical protein
MVGKGIHKIHVLQQADGGLDCVERQKFGLPKPTFDPIQDIHPS